MPKNTRSAPNGQAFSLDQTAVATEPTPRPIVMHGEVVGVVAQHRDGGGPLYRVQIEAKQGTLYVTLDYAPALWTGYDVTLTKAEEA